MTTFADRLVSFYAGLQLKTPLPHGVEVLNPYQHAETMACVRAFCERFFADNTERLSCWGINPGRFGGGLTGLSFTDPVILRDVVGIQNNLGFKQELSAEFIWSVIHEFGGADAFFSQIFLTALCPLGFTNAGVNYNFYDDYALLEAVKPFMVKTIHEQLALGLRRDVAVCFGTGKLQKAFVQLNNEHHFFASIVALEHPRFIMQYRRPTVHEYRQKYIKTLQSALSNESLQSNVFPFPLFPAL